MLRFENNTTQTLSNITQAKPNYPFVDWIRFVAMFSIVYEHSPALPEGKPEMIDFNPFTAMPYAQQEASLWISQPLKFGTICFFIISGYLLGKQLKGNYGFSSYYKKRLNVVGIPFLIAFLLFYIKSIGTFGILIGRYDISMLTAEWLGYKFWNALFFTSYWFIFIFLLSLGLMLIGWHYVGLRIVSYLSFFAALFYAVNIYTNWIEPRHTLAFPAYVFYLCIGVYLSKNDLLIKRLQNFPTVWLTGFMLVSFFVAILESELLWKTDSIAPLNSIRLSNQIFSVLVFFWLIRHNYLQKIPFVNPRTESFGIYLYHLFFVSLITRIIAYFPTLSFLNYQSYYSGWELTGATILRFILIYTSTLLFVKLVNKTRFKWFFGNHSSQ